MGGTRGFLKDKEIKGMQKEIRKSEEKTTNEAFEVEVSAEINTLLTNYNNRDTNAIESRIDTIIKAIQNISQKSFRAAL